MTPSAEPTDGLTIDGERFKVLVNDEEQYAIYPEDLPTPAGWRETGERGGKAEMIAYVDRTWTDMRPLSLRRAMDGDGSRRVAPL
jgi:MbtH protein